MYCSRVRARARGCVRERERVRRVAASEASRPTRLRGSDEAGRSLAGLHGHRQQVRAVRAGVAAVLRVSGLPVRHLTLGAAVVGRLATRAAGEALLLRVKVGW